MSDPITDDVLNHITQMTREQFDELVSKTRPAEDSRDPKTKAVLALRDYRGIDRRGAGQRIDSSNPAQSSKEAAAEALRAVRGIHKVTFEGDD